MKNILILLLTTMITFPILAQNNNNTQIDKLWTEIEQLNKKDLPKTQLEKVEQIYNIAVSQNNDIELIKAINFKATLLVKLSEEGCLDAINFLQSQYKLHEGTNKHLCSFMIGMCYQNYYSNNYYEIRERSTISENAVDDSARIEFLDPNAFIRNIIKYYTTALDTSLQNIPAVNYKSFFADLKDVDKFYPTLYDQLGIAIVEQLTALRHNSNYQKIDKSLKCSVEDFAHLQIVNNDNKPKIAAMQILQKLVIANQANPNTLILLDLKRWQALSLEDNDEIVPFLEILSKKYSDSEMVIFVNLELAEFLSQKSENIKAIDLLEKTIAKFAKSTYIQPCKAKLAEIKSPDLTFSVNELIYPNENFPITFNYYNTKQVELKIIKYNKNIAVSEYFYLEEKSAKALFEQKAILEKTVKLPETSDLLNHKTCYVSNELSAGSYIIFAKITSEDGQSKLSYSPIVVSEFALLKVDKNAYLVLDRNSGKPIDNVNVNLVANFNNQKTKTILTTKTDSTGYFKFSLPDKTYYYDFKLQLKTKTETTTFALAPDRHLREYYIDSKEKLHLKTFTDRAIYRPGQTVYFKTIAYEGEKNSFQVAANKEVTICMNDSYGKEVARKNFTTNTYGSVNGSFEIPNDVLTGNFYIKAICDNKSENKFFTVEEYKRPSFEVSLENVKDAVNYGDTVVIKGNAKSYAGVPVSNAKVDFSVECTSYARYYWLESRSEEVDYGTITTDENGDFSIEFIAKQCFENINIFTLSAKVTDISGEVQTANTSLRISEQNIWLDATIDSQVEITNFNKIEISSTNISDNHVGTDVTVKIELLEEIDKPRSAAFNCDKQLYTQNEWENLCPNIHYEDKSLENRKVAALLHQNTINTDETNFVIIEQKEKYHNGTYRLTLTCTDKNGKQITTVKHFQIYQNKAGKMPFVATNFFTLTQTKAEVGDTVKLLLGTSFSDVTAYYTIQKYDETIAVQNIKIDNELKVINIPITEDCRGNIGVTVAFIKYGKKYDFEQSISVERSDKKLKVDFITFRDKTLPGSNETWQLRITDNNNLPAKAEFMASVYDASLDSYAANDWNLYPYTNFYLEMNFDARGLQQATNRIAHSINTPYYNKNFPCPHIYFYELNNTSYGYRVYYDMARPMATSRKLSLNNAAYEDIVYEEEVASDAIAASGAMETAEIEQDEAFENVQVRTNFNETAVFAPTLITDSAGDVFLNFTLPESLTRWNVLGLAHTKQMQIGTATNSLITQKRLSITPNLPRFFREGDEMYISTKIANLTENNISGQAKIEFLDAQTSQNITSQFLKDNICNFSVEGEKNIAVEWKISIPQGLGAVSVRIVALGDGHSDGEEKILPILTNRMLVTETMPLPIRKAGTTNFDFKAMQNNSTSLQHHKYTLEYTANPAWYAVLALPYMIEYPYECAEQTFSRIYANLIASHIANSDPKIRQMFDTWQNDSAQTLNSNLQRNEELKSVLLENSPWLLDAENEAENKQNLGNLFDKERLNTEIEKYIQKLQKMQISNGAWPWFEGMSANLYVTMCIASNYGHLKKLSIAIPDNNFEKNIKKAIGYIDDEIVRIYKEQVKYKNVHLGNLQIYYLYLRSFYSTDYQLNKSTQEVYEIYLQLAEKEWVDNSFYMRGMLALALHRSGKKAITEEIVNSLKQYAQHSDELGMYWDNQRGWFWYNNSIETQTLLIELFHELGLTNDVNEMKVWLLKQKQTQNWKTTKTTAEAVYALLLEGTSILSDTDYPKISIGNEKIDLGKEQTEAGTGYFKKSWSGEKIARNWSQVSIKKSKNTVSWGSVYWQYFEDLDKIKSFEETPLKIRKSLFVKRVKDSKQVIVPLENSTLKVGETVTVRIEIELDRDMEYVHLKDMRASAFEPIDKLSGYRFGASFGYYLSIKDASMIFFIDYLPKGKYVFEYEMFATQRGNFSNGVTTIQSMYAPEFTSHNKGERVVVE